MSYSDGVTEVPEGFRDRWEAGIAARIAREGDCLVWTGSLNRNGYGVIVGPGGRGVVAHRANWLLRRGPIPAGMVLDHLCMNTRCVEPEHLEIVTQQENVRRAIAHHQAAGTSNWAPLNEGDLCRSGRHVMEGDNRMLVKRGGNPTYTCRECQREKQRAYVAAHPEKIAEYQRRRREKKKLA